MLHGISDPIRDSINKFLDTALGFCRDAFIVVFSVHYRRHQVKRQKHTEDLEARTSALESSVRKLRGESGASGNNTVEHEHSKGAAAGQSVDLHSHGAAVRVRARNGKPPSDASGSD